MHSSSTEWKTLRATTLSLALALAGGSALLAAPAPAQSPASAVPAATMVRGLPDFTELVEQVGPSVVNIRTLEKVSGRVGPAGMDEDMLEFFRRFGLPVPDDQLAELPYLRFPEDSAEYKYMMQRRVDLGGFLPQRRRKAEALPVPGLDAFGALLKASGEGRELSTTMAIVRIMNTLLKDKQIGKNIVPIVPDESRTFGMEGMFRQYGIWNQQGQKYVPEDHDQLMFYKESETGQVLQEGINEAGAMADWIAAGTAYSVHGVQMVPFYIFYSMFGLQRTMDLCWAAGDQRARGFLVGGIGFLDTPLRNDPLYDGPVYLLNPLLPQ